MIKGKVMNKLGKVFITLGVILIVISISMLIYNKYEDIKAYKFSQEVLVIIEDNISDNKVKAAAFFPTVLKTFVEPAFPLPFSLTSNPAIFLLINIEKLTLPIA